MRVINGRRLLIGTACGALALAGGCSGEKGKQISAVEALVRSMDVFQQQARIVPKDEKQIWDNLTQPGRQIGALEVVYGCGDHHGNASPILPDIQGFNGSLTGPTAAGSGAQGVAFTILNDQRLFDFKPITFTSPMETQAFVCQIPSSTINAWIAQHQDLVQGAPDSGLSIAFAKRGEPSFEFTNAYTTELPMKGQVPVVSVRFSYDMTPLLPGLQAVTKGTGAIKAILDSDSGQWTILETQVTDGEIRYSSEAATHSGSRMIVVSAPTMPPPSAQSTAQRAMPAPVECHLVTDEEYQKLTLQGKGSPIKNRITIGPGDAIAWNGTAINLLTLRQYLDATVQLNPTPYAILDGKPGASPGLEKQVRDLARLSNLCAK